MYFTVCIPMYNRKTTVGRTLDSLVAQSFKDFEVIVIDDGSTDGGDEIVRNYEKNLDLQYIYKRNGGKHTALNKGIELAKGKFFIICDSDDYLLPYALQKLFEFCKVIELNDEYCGVMCRCKEHSTDKIIGALFPDNPFISSYVDFHFVSGQKRKYIDCFEANKTSIMKKYRYPEPENTKFVPEAYIFDQIGLNYKLYCKNDVLMIKEYLDGGITKDNSHYKKNVIGYLYDYVMKLDNIFPNINVSIRARIIMWWKYWNAYNLCTIERRIRVKKVTFLGRIVGCLCPLINIAKKINIKD